MVPYNHQSGLAPVPEWPKARTKQHVDGLQAMGGTNSSFAVEAAFKHLNKPLEIDEHKKMIGLTPDLMMVFMTDGNNNQRGFDTATIKTCDAAKQEKVEIFTVAFQVPRNGKALLKNCASDVKHYFEPKNVNELIAAFKKIGANTAKKIYLSR